MKRLITLCAYTFIYIGIAAQPTGISAILQEIEQNNPELKANRELVAAQKWAIRADNNLPDPSLSYSYLWSRGHSDETVSELIVSQSFDFPTLYATRSRMNRLKGRALDAQAAAFRQEILLQAELLCLDIVTLDAQQTLLELRLKNAEELSALYRQRLETGDANILEVNKLNLELLNVRTSSRLNQTELSGKLKALLALNGDTPLTAGRPLPDAVPTAQVLGLTHFPAAVVPASFHPLADELLAADPALQSLQDQGEAAQKQISTDRQGWLPRLELGYRRNTETGHPLNGMLVGFSFPLFENRGKVKAARSQALHLDYRQENARLQASARLWQLYEEARNLQAAIGEYRRTLGDDTSPSSPTPRESNFGREALDLLRQALDGGQISLIDYFLEAATVYQAQSNLLQLQNQYHQTLARLYQSRL